jgi:outer membrane receptor for ferrienterochelin and colicins
MNVGYSYNGRNNILMQRTESDQYFFSHEARANASWLWKKPGLTLSLFYKFNGRMQSFQYDIVSDQIHQGYISSFSLLDGSVSRAFFSHRMQVTCGVRNILDVRNVNATLTGGPHSGGSSSMPAAMGRTVYTSLRFTIEHVK